MASSVNNARLAMTNQETRPSRQGDRWQRREDGTGMGITALQRRARTAAGNQLPKLSPDGAEARPDYSPG